MPTEFRFDDLDLREEPASKWTDATPVTLGCPTNQTKCTCSHHCTPATEP